MPSFWAAGFGEHSLLGANFRRKPLATRRTLVSFALRGSRAGLYLIGRVLPSRSKGLGLIHSTVKLRKKFG